MPRRTRGYKTNGRPITTITDYYRDDYDMLLEILSCRWSEVVVIGLRRFGKTSFLKRLEGFVNCKPEYQEFLEKGLDGWDRDRSGNPPRKEFFDTLNELDAGAVYLSFLDGIDIIEQKSLNGLKELSVNQDIDTWELEKIEGQLPSVLFILMDELSRLADIKKDGESEMDKQKAEEAKIKCEFLLKLHQSAQHVQTKDVVFIIAEPPSVFTVFEESGEDVPVIREVAEAIQARKLLYLNGLSPCEKHDLFHLTKTQNNAYQKEPEKIRQLLKNLSGIPLEIQVAGAAFFHHPEKPVTEILEDVTDAFGGLLMQSIIPTMTIRQRTLVRLLVESENEKGGLSWNALKKTGHTTYHQLKEFGLLKQDEKKFVRFTSIPIANVLCGQLESSSKIIDDAVYNKEVRHIHIINDVKQEGIKSPPWDGKLLIHHLSDFALGDLAKGFEPKTNLDLMTLNGGKNPFHAYFHYLQANIQIRPHIIVITGDIALNNHSCCYTGFLMFLRGLLKWMKPLPGSEKVELRKQIILVPGEMDMSAPPAVACHEPPPKKKVDECAFNLFFHTFEEFGLPPEDATANRVENKISIKLPMTTNAPGYVLELLPFNSATMVWPDKSKNQRIGFLRALEIALEKGDPGQIREKFERLLGEDIGFINLEGIEKDIDRIDPVDDTLRIAVTHHNLNPHKSRGEACTVDTLNALAAKTVLLNNQFGIILHGHQRYPIFIKETLYERTVIRLKTLHMNGAGRFTETEYEMDNDNFTPSFNCYEVQQQPKGEIENSSKKSDFKMKSMVFSYLKDGNKFIREKSEVNEEIFLNEVG